MVGNGAALEMVRSGRSAAYLTDTPTLLYFAGEAPCDLEVVGPHFGPGTKFFLDYFLLQLSSKAYNEVKGIEAFS